MDISLDEWIEKNMKNQNMEASLTTETAKNNGSSSFRFERGNDMSDNEDAEMVDEKNFSLNLNSTNTPANSQQWRIDPININRPAGIPPLIPNSVPKMATQQQNSNNNRYGFRNRGRNYKNKRNGSQNNWKNKRQQYNNNNNNRQQYNNNNNNRQQYNNNNNNRQQQQSAGQKFKNNRIERSNRPKQTYNASNVRQQIGNGTGIGNGNRETPQTSVNMSGSNMFDINQNNLMNEINQNNLMNVGNSLLNQIGNYLNFGQNAIAQNPIMAQLTNMAPNAILAQTPFIGQNAIVAPNALIGQNALLQQNLANTIAGKFFQMLENTNTKHKPVYDDKIQQEIAQLQNKERVVSGSGVNVKIVPNTTGKSMDSRFA